MNKNIVKTKALGLAVAVAATSAMLLPGTSQAAWPERPITVVVMYGAGGGTDTVIRTITGEMAKSTGWTINVINKPGAVGGVATKYVLGKAADGYTWMGAANFNKFVRVMGHSNSKAWEDWQYYKAANASGSWSVRADSPFKNMDDVISAAKKNPGKVSISTSGSGGLWHELAATVALAAGVTLKYVPYKGGKKATLAGLQGETDIAGGGVHEHIDLIRAGKLRHIQQTSANDIVDAKGGTLKSVGGLVPAVKSSLPMGRMYNIAIRRGAPLDILKKVETAFRAAVNSKKFKAVAKKKYFTIDIKTGAEADKTAALMETLTANTFAKLGIKGSVPASKLGIPSPAGFNSWWPPKGYKPRM